MLTVSELSAGYGRIRVIEGLAFSIEAGECVTLLGPNGAGKSTTVLAIMGCLRERAGRVTFDGHELGGALTHRIVAAGLALVPEGRRVFAPLSVTDNLRLGAIGLAGRTPLAERYEAVFSLFPRLRERQHQVAGTLSGGEQQMLAIGRALMSSPRMLLLDEPFLGLAPLIVNEIEQALVSLMRTGLTILLIEQKLEIALSLASRALVMIKGRIALEERSASLIARPDLDTLYITLAATAPAANGEA
jgi:branched-chain amino acid transport system ATP-binding protein